MGNDGVNMWDILGKFVTPTCPNTEALEALGRALAALQESYKDMKKANTIGADKYFHCIGMCKASRTSDSSIADALGRFREIFDNLKNRFPGCRKLDDLEQAADSFKDTEANRTGFNCPENKSCECCCKKSRVSG